MHPYKGLHMIYGCAQANNHNNIIKHVNIVLLSQYFHIKYIFNQLIVSISAKKIKNKKPP